MAEKMLKIKEIQNDLYTLMKTVHDFCISNEIEYSLTGGSLLGAIRHNGFIPWDDDLDIMMTRDNYNKFRNCYEKNGLGECVFERDQWVYRVRKTHKEKGFIPSIDFFIIDKAPANPVIGMLQVFFLKVLQGMLRTNEKKGEYSSLYTILIKISEGFGKLFRNNTLFNWYDQISQWGNKSNSQEVSIFNDRFKLIGLRYDSSLTSEYKNHVFEDTEFRIIEKYNDYLTLQFGDYMQLPPEQERVPQHIF